ncbi:DNA-binding protein [Gordonia sp. HNM0687]|uniref:DNA-binding protein n=1 Tax=Gordonia mangrovi TaxID=2665643 RepID=A0A6L7GKT3_9ACTN|nr:OB-fold domain-containing protein [Gordonia mangrovi]MXP19997.1 DNA-binding protein [Gordonia mangrovi]UVF79387.1 OB-fold domain-containing protein [Gordonia mangrovi]
MSPTSQLFAARDPLQLAGSRCTTCTTTTFPPQSDCPRCTTRSMSEVALPREGTLWTWTVQTFCPKPPFVAPPEGFTPFCVGYIDLGEVIVESLLDAGPDELRTAARMRLVPHRWDTPDGEHATGYAFRPVEEDV